MMAACPNCRAHINDEQMFCRACGFRLDTGFQISTQKLGLPPTAPLQISGRATSHSAPTGACWRNNMLPIAGFILALFLSGFTAALFNEEPLQLNHGNSFTITSERAYMGVYLVDVNVNSDLNYVTIDRIVESSPAEQAGLRSGDRIRAIDDITIYSTGEVVAKLTATTPGVGIKVQFERNDEINTVFLTTVRRRELDIQSLCHHEGFLGVGELTTSTKENAGFEDQSTIDGVRIGMIVENSAAQRAGLQEGDMILSINNAATRSPEELSRQVRAIYPNQTVEVRLMRDGEMKTEMVTLGSHE